MKYKYNITYRQNDKSKLKNFKNKTSLLLFLEEKKNISWLKEMDRIVINFGSVALPIKQTIWKL